MKSIIRPIEFVSPLSEVEVRMTLKELCGSKWDNFPFDGEVDKNSFRLKKINVLLFTPEEFQSQYSLVISLDKANEQR